MMTRCSIPMFVQRASCSGENRNRPTFLQTAGFELLDYTAINLKRPKVTGWEVGVSSDTIRLGLLGGTFYPNVSKYQLTLLRVSDLAYPVTLLRDGSDLEFYKGHSLLMLGA